MSTLRTNEIEMLDGEGSASFTFDALKPHPVDGPDENLTYLVDSTQVKVGQKVRTLGYYEPGDGGGNDYEIVAAGTSTDDGGSFIDLAGSGLQVKGLFQYGVYVDQFGANGNGSDIDDAFIEAAAAYAMSSGAPLQLSPKIYLVDAVDISCTADLEIRFNRGVLKGTSADYLMVRIDAGSTTRYQVTLTGYGVVDGTQRTNTPNVASGEGISVRYSDNLSVDKIYFTSGMTLGDGFGDSGLVPFACNKINVTSCWFSGWDDHPIYVTGGADASPDKLSESFVLTGSHFYNTGGVRLAREHRVTNITSNTFQDVYVALVTSGGETNWGAAFSNNIIGNVVSGCEAVAFDLRFHPSSEGNTISGNQIYDWSKSVSGPAINLRGVQNTAVTGNTVIPRDSIVSDSTSVCRNCLYITTADNDDLVSFTGGNNTVTGNILKVLEHDVGETDNKCIRLVNSDPNVIGLNNVLNSPEWAISILENGSNVTIGSPQYLSSSDVGYGFGVITPKGVVDIGGDLVISRPIDSAVNDRFMRMGSGVTHSIKAHSDPTAATALQIDATTDDSDTTPTSGSLGIQLRILGVNSIIIEQDRTVRLISVPSDPSGLPTGTIYKDVDGFLKIV